MKKKFGIDIGYHKAWSAIQKVVACIRGTPEENYQILPSYLHMMVAKNPGTYTSIKRDAQNRFAYMFFAPTASVAGWSYCRPVIAIEARFLKSKYRGVLFVVVSKDANNQIFPLCFGVAESENNEAYIWFFGEMRKAIQVRRELVFLSDRNQSIANGIRKVFPEAHHGICLYHFEKNLKQRHAKATVINLLQSAARSYKREDFNQLMSQLKSIDKKTYNYIMEEPPERWARSWFPRRRYDMLTKNMAESMNSVLLKGKEMPIFRMLHFIQEKLGEWFYERRKKANKTFHRVSIWAEEEMTKKMDLACKMFVFNLDSILFRINSEGIEFIVDLKKRTSHCLEFQLDELPCPHAIAAIN
ncbi:PREDICTED: protein FAR1-RELATED SEQUENCE 4-like [Nicotiana attenuata]|uniref:protein FAR1-RELATED SEQUENCE 4-like n=1 Tax=Nicotiana attenuata TaxID=49451 RepID=UPI000905D25A|nr:PREDICTED: protein FAR1-RELATED SEQUENCE 4-like [Nicotiana attenuata]